jgi:hypothetical protein
MPYSSSNSSTMDVDTATAPPVADFAIVTRDDGDKISRYAAILRRILFEKTTRVVAPQLQLYRTLFGIAPQLFELDKPFHQDGPEDKLKFAVRVRMMPDPVVPVAPAAPAAPASGGALMPSLGGAAPAVPAAPAVTAAPAAPAETFHRITFVGFWNGTEFIPTTLERDNSVANQPRIVIAQF